VKHRTVPRHQVAGLIAVCVIATAAPAAASTPDPSPDDAGWVFADIEVGPAAESSVAYPLDVTTAFGTTTIDAPPQTVATVTTVDTDIALALGFDPVIAPQYGDAGLSQYTLDAFAVRGWEPEVYDSTDGVDFEAIAETEPDVILAVSDWSAADNFDRLTDIAPVIGLPEEDDYLTMTWQDRITIAAAALGVPERAEQVIATVDDSYAAVADAHPQWQGLTYTYAVIHPTQISYMSTADAPIALFAGLGFVLPEAAGQFSAEDSAVSMENIIQLDADVLLIGYPFGPEGLLGQDELESDPLFQAIPAVADGRYGVIGDDIASDIAYPTPLSETWVLDRLVPILEDATDSAGG